MLRKRVSWFSGSVLSGGVAMYLTWLGVADKLPPWSLYAGGGVALVASISQFPAASGPAAPGGVTWAGSSPTGSASPANQSAQRSVEGPTPAGSPSTHGHSPAPAAAP